MAPELVASAPQLRFWPFNAHGSEQLRTGLAG